MNKKRIEYLDYAKAFAIISVLLNHSAIEFRGMNCFTMAVFFISSGYTYNSDQDSFGVCLSKKFKRLLIPFFAAMAVSALLEVVRGTFIGYGSIKSAIPVIANMFYGSGLFPNVGSLGRYLIDIPPFTLNTKYMIDIIMPTNCQLWALPVMFSGYMIFYLYRKFLKNRNILTDVAAILVFLLLTSIETIPGIFQLPFGIGRGFICVAFMIVGYWFKEYKVLEDSNIIRVIAIMLLSTMIAVASILLGSDVTGMVISTYGPYGIWSIAITFLCGVCSAYVVFMICRFIHSLSFAPVNNLFAFIGRNTMEVFLWHFVVFFIFDVVFISIFNPVLSINQFYDELFSEGYIVYRVLRIILTIICLSQIGEFKLRSKFRKASNS